jgi:hypothetical protein
LKVDVGEKHRQYKADMERLPLAALNGFTVLDAVVSGELGVLVFLVIDEHVLPT